MSLWRHSRCHVKNSEHCQKSSKSRVFAIFVTKMCSFVVEIVVRVHLGMAFVKIKYKLCNYLRTKTWKTSFLCSSHWKVQAGSQWSPPVPSTFGGTGTLTLLKVVPQIFFTKMTATDELTTTYKCLVNYLNVLVQSKKIYRGSQCPPPFPVRQVLRFSWLFKWVLSQITINEK